MKPSVTGVLSFGLVSVPVGVASAVKTTNDPAFRTLHQLCKQPVSLRTTATQVEPAESAPLENGPSVVKWCETCNVAAEETIKGFEYAKGEFVYFSDAELEAASAERSPRIEIHKFVKAGEIRSSMIEKHYFLIPNKTINDAYGLLYQALAELKVAGIGTQSLWGKEHPCAICAVQDFPSGGVMMMQTLRVAEDLAVPDFSSPIPKREAKKLAKDVVSSLIGEFNPQEDLVSASRQRMLSMIAAKIEGRELPETGDGKVEAVPDLMQALRDTLAEREAVRDAGKPEKPQRVRAASKK